MLLIAIGLRQQSRVFCGVVCAFSEMKSWTFKRLVLIGDTTNAVATVVEAWPISKPSQGVAEQRVDDTKQEVDIARSGIFVAITVARQQ